MELTVECGELDGSDAKMMISSRLCTSGDDCLSSLAAFANVAEASKNL